ncbi:MAG TPA: type I DNA topoisomerase, partial [Phycisphaerae bacterium]|nr:type I DNA topoisomerase [Phycisphaerae bacterium]
YVVDPGRKRLIGELTRAAKKAKTVYLATDLDREGEAIAWHLAAALDLPAEKTRRVVFNEITKSAIQHAFAHPHNLDMDRVNAQQARRILDRIVGYQLSPLLWKKVAKGLSAGRVQSVAVRLIVEREWEIRAFVPTESWRITGCFATQVDKAAGLAVEWEEFLEGGADPDTGRTTKERFAWLSSHGCLQAQLVKLDGRPFEPANVDECRAAAEGLGFVCEAVDENAWEEYADHGLKTIDLNGRTAPQSAPAFTVADIQTKRTRTKPPGPFITATLQQAASTQLGFSTSRTMRVAQQLYEGVDLGNGEGPVGVITYMRTDSTALSGESIREVRALIEEQFGRDYLPAKPNRYGSGKRAQEAHEAVRPTDVALPPDALKGKLSADQHKLYSLIWRRFVACQMPPAQWDATTVLVTAPTSQGEAVFKATGRRLVFDGYQRVAGQSPSKDPVLPDLAAGQRVAPLQIDPQQKFTSPPPRYSEASLVKALEAEGIGRPSTYAQIIQTIQDRGYVEQMDRRFFATDKGQIVTEKLVKHFPRLMDVKFTSHMEDELDKIEEAHLDWVHVLNEFYGPFKQQLDKADVEMEAARAEPSEYKCPKCGKEMVYRWARTGRFLSCTAYPDCTGAFNVDREGKPIIPEEVDVACEACGETMLLRQSRHGPFLGCSAYPECTNTIPCSERGVPHRLVTEKELEEPCEACGEGTMKVRRAGVRNFLGCDRYPGCKNTKRLPKDVRLERKVVPVEEAGISCERCGRPMVIRTGRRGKFIACPGYPRCRNTKPIEKLDELQALARENGTVPAPAGNGRGGKAQANGRARSAVPGTVPKTPEGKVDFEALGPPPPGFAWTRTGRPVVETWPEDTLQCPQCGSEMAVKSGRFGPFFSCTNFPKCRCSVNLRGEAKKRGEIEMPAPVRPKPIPTDVPCEECGEKMVIRVGRSGKFLGCSKYPKCKFTKPLPEELNAAASKAAG